MAEAMTEDELLALPAVVPIRTAGRALGIGEGKSYELAASGAFPVRVLRFGRTYRVPTAELLELLGVTREAVEVNGVRTA
jgi:hypothetical protein